MPPSTAPKAPDTPTPPSEPAAPPGPAQPPAPTRLPSDFHRLWLAYSTSEFGSQIGHGALRIIAILALGATDFQVSLLAALSAVGAAVIALPAGLWIEHRRKRPVMIGADLARFLVLASIPAAAAFGRLTYAQLCVVGVVQTLGVIVFGSASTAHLKNLVPAGLRIRANSRFETTTWTMVTAGPPLGGLLISWLGTTVTVAVDAVSFLLSALGVRRLRTPEPDPPVREGKRHLWRDVTGGWRYILAHSGLRALFWNAMLFGGGILMMSPISAVFMLRDLAFTPWQFGLALGIPGLGGVLGSLFARRLSGRFGDRRVLLGFGVLRAVWCFGIPLAAPGTAGLVLIITAETLLLVCAGIFNPVFATYRMGATSDAYMARVSAAWSISGRVVQPLFILAGGVIAAYTDARTALFAASGVIAASALLLPWRRSAMHPGQRDSAVDTEASADSAYDTTASAYASSSGPSRNSQR